MSEERLRSDRASDGEVDRERKRQALANGEEPARMEVREDAGAADEVGVVGLDATQNVFSRRGRDDVADDEGVRSKAVHDALQLALEVEAAALYEHAVDDLGGERPQGRERGFGSVVQTARRSEAGLQDELLVRKARRERSMLESVPVRRVSRTACEAVVRPPADRHRHVLRSDVEAAALLGRDEHERRNRKDTGPER